MTPDGARPDFPPEAEVERLRTIEVSGRTGHHEIMIPMLAWAIEESLV